jgi:hypothetical protein
MTLQVDYKKLGYRWMGTYNASTNYINRDVVYKDGASFYYDTATESFQLFARGQIEATNKGDLIIKDTSLGQLFADEKLYVTNGSISFRHPIDRNGTRCVDLGGWSDNHMGSQNHATYQRQMFLMGDGTVRGIGRNWNGTLGSGNTPDEAHGLLTPIQVQFPKGTPNIVKVFQSPHANHFIDADGQLWGMGHDYTVGSGLISGNAPTAVNVSENSDIGNNRIVDVFYGGYFRYDAHQYFAKDENGRIYTWGYNYNSTSGLGSLTNEQKSTATLIPFTVHTPISKVNTNGFSNSYMIDTEGKAYSVGLDGTNYRAITTTEWSVIPFVQGSVKEIGCHIGIGTNSADYRATHLLLNDGRLYARSNGYQQVGLGLPDGGGNFRIFDDSEIFGSNIRRAYFKNGYAPMMIAQTNNGDWLFRGYNGYNFSPTDVNVNLIDTTNGNGAAWDQAAYRYSSVLWNNNIGKAVLFGEDVYPVMGFLNTSNKKVFVMGHNGEGIRGLGHFSDGHPGGTDFTGEYNNNDVYDNTYVVLDENVIDFEFGGYKRHTGSGGTIDSRACLYLLTELGDVYAVGGSHYYMNGAWNQTDTCIPQKISF